MNIAVKDIKKIMVEETHICNIEFLFWHFGYFGMVEEKHGWWFLCALGLWIHHHPHTTTQKHA